MTEFHKVFKIERDGSTLILIPQDNQSGFRRADLQTESNSVRRIVDEAGTVDLVVDLGQLDFFGSELIGAIIRIARHVCDCGGRAAMCNASEKMRDVLETMNLSKLWPYFATREEALKSFQA